VSFGVSETLKKKNENAKADKKLDLKYCDTTEETGTKEKGQKENAELQTFKVTSSEAMEIDYL
jgi:hypothetical protein